MKRLIAPETIVVKFKPYDEADLSPERLYQLHGYLDKGYQSEDYGSYTRVFRKPYIEFCVDGDVIADATEKLAEQVAEEISSGVLEMFCDGESFDFERHSLQKTAV